MFRRVDSARVRALAAPGEGGFTLIEIMVALTLVLTAAAASIPLLIVGMKAANTSKLNTQAKNVAQQRMESMRDLPFHVDRQNGPFVDLLDIYYTNLSATQTSRTRAGETEVGQWVSGGASSPAPSGPFYKVTVTGLPGFANFSQTIYTQFLSASGAALASSTLTGYDSQTEGNDQPRSLMVGVTVITTWNDHGVSHSYTSYTRISDSRGLTSTLTTQGSANFLQVQATGQAGNALAVDVASADASGSQSTGSVAAVDVRTIEARDATGQDYEGATATATSPGTVSGTGPMPAWDTGSGNNDCGWVGSGPTQVSQATADTLTGGLPKVPTNVDTAVPPVNQAAAQITSGNGSNCGVFGFANQSTSYSSALMLSATAPLVQINADNSNPNAVMVSGSAWVNASLPTAVPHTVMSGANTGSSKSVRLFPGASFTGGEGVVKVKLTQSSIACLSSVSGGVAAQTSVGSWTVAISYWKATDLLGHGNMVDLPTYTWNSVTGTGSADPLASINPSSIIVYQNGLTVLRLSDYISSWSTERSIVENPASGVHQLDGIVSIATQQVRDSDIMSGLGLQIGNLSCVADDNR